MHAEGFEYGSIVVVVPPAAEVAPCKHNQEDPSLKPTTGPTLWCSRITDDTLQWHTFVVDQEYETERYAKGNLLFVKVDASRIATESDQRFQKGGAWRGGEQMMIRWSRVAAEYAGITVDPVKCLHNDVFQTWDVDTLAIWDLSCVTETRTFENTGVDWTYRNE
jgi:hypothetical protein